VHTITAVKREPWNSLVNYNPQMGIGMRTKRHFFPDGAELMFLDGPPHVQECFHRRYHQHLFKNHLIIHSHSIDQQIHETYNSYDPGRINYKEPETGKDVDINAVFYIWH